MELAGPNVVARLSVSGKMIANSPAVVYPVAGMMSNEVI